MKPLTTLVLALALGAPATAQTPAPAAPDVPMAVRAFEGARAASDRDGGKLWGVRIYGPTLFVDAATRRVVANGADREGRLTPEGGAFVGALPASLPVANTSVEWAGVRWAMILWPIPTDEEDRTSLVLHESFHRVQPELGMAAASPANAHLDALDGRYLFRLECRALSAAIASKGAARDRALADALAFRARRRALFPSAATEENALERNEGLAEYTGQTLASTSPAAHARALLDDVETRPSYTRSFAYATGPAYGVLLDARAPRWRGGITTTSDLGGLAVRAYGMGAVDASERSVERRAASYGGAAVRNEEVARDTTRRERDAKAKARFVDGPVLVVPLRKMQISFDPNTLQPLGDLGTVYPTMTISDAWGVLEVTGGGALLAADWSSVTLPAPAGEAEGGTLAGDGWTIRLAGGWHVAAGKRPEDRTLVEP